MFIKLTSSKYGNFVRVNVAHLEFYEKVNEEAPTTISICAELIGVKETPEEIDEMVKKCLSN